MKKVYYWCKKCHEPFRFDASETGDFLCPKCGKKMEYSETCEIDPATNKVINRYQEEERKRANPPIRSDTIFPPTVICPYCQSANTQKIGFFSRVGSAELWGLGSPELGKNFKCNRCGAYF